MDEFSGEDKEKALKKLLFALLITHLPAGRQGLQKMILEISGFFRNLKEDG